MPLTLGQRVRLSTTGELGVVVWLWHNEQINAQEAYVAFVGSHWPTAAPSDIPYVLRYMASSLEPIGGAS